MKFYNSPTLKKNFIAQLLLYRKRQGGGVFCEYVSQSKLVFQVGSTDNHSFCPLPLLSLFYTKFFLRVIFLIKNCNKDVPMSMGNQKKYGWTSLSALTSQEWWQKESIVAFFVWWTMEPVSDCYGGWLFCSWPNIVSCWTKAVG